jgi:hypothetical protein
MDEWMIFLWMGISEDFPMAKSICGANIFRATAKVGEHAKPRVCNVVIF